MKKFHHRSAEVQKIFKRNLSLRLCGLGEKLFILFFSFIIPLHAQDYEKVAPKLPEPAPEEQPLIESSPEKFFGNGTVVVKELRALVFVKSVKEIRKDGLPLDQNKFGAQKHFISAKDFPILQTEEFAEEMETFLGKPLSMKKLNELTRKVVEYYSRQGQPIVWVRLPEQKITDGIVQLVVKESTLEDIEISGQKWIDESEIRDQLRLRKGDLVQQNILLSDMGWINRNPFRQVTAAYKAGEEPGTTDIYLQVHDRFPARFYTGYENTGSAVTGEDRWYGGFNWGDAFGLTNNLFNYQFTTSSDFDGLQAHSASDIFPLPWRHLLNVFGSYNETEAEVAPPMELRGKSWNVGTRYIVPLPQINFEKDLWLEQNVQAGFDFKQSNNNLEFGGTLVTNSLTDIDQFVYNYNATLHDCFGETILGATFYQSPGGLTDNDKNSKYQASRALADADYCYARFELSRQTQLPYQFSLNNTLVGQWSNSNLLASEQLSLGGRDTIRGYEECEARGDEGWYTRNELRFPPLSFGKLFGNFRCKEFNDRLVLLAFWDYGVAQNKHLLADENRDTELSSVGPALRYTITPYLNASFDYGFQLLDTSLDANHHSKLHISITLSY